MSWQCTHCNHWTADGQKHECVYDELKSLQLRISELEKENERLDQITHKWADHDEKQREKIATLELSLERQNKLVSRIKALLDNPTLTVIHALHKIRAALGESEK